MPVATSLATAQFGCPRYGFPSWPKLKATSTPSTGRAAQAAIDPTISTGQGADDPQPGTAQAPLGYGKNGPLTWAAECRVPWEPPSPARLAIAGG